MKHPALDTIPRTLLFICLFILAGALIPLCLAGLIPVKTSILVVQGAISGLLFCGISVLLWYVIRFTNLSGTHTIQGIFNHTALLVLTLFIWIGTEYFLGFLLFPENTFQLLMSLIPFKIVIDVLICLIVIQYYVKTPLTDTIEEMSDTPSEKNTPDVPATFPDSPATLESKNTLIKITVKTGSNIHIIPVTDLLYLQSEGDYVFLYTEKARYIKEETMKNLEVQLPSTFIRIHRSCIVNTNFISRIELYEKQYYQITLKTGHKLKASNSGYKLLKENLNL